MVPFQAAPPLFGDKDYKYEQVVRLMNVSTNGDFIRGAHLTIVCATSNMLPQYGLSKDYLTQCRDKLDTVAFNPPKAQAIVLCPRIFLMRNAPSQSHCPAWEIKSQQFALPYYTPFIEHRSYTIVRAFTHTVLNQATDIYVWPNPEISNCNRLLTTLTRKQRRKTPALLQPYLACK